jgi:hypothetical protein
MIFALVKDNVVVNTIVADQNFVNLIISQYDHVVRIDNLAVMPSVNWSYVNEEFIAPQEV